jgi:hypothetical protein
MRNDDHAISLLLNYQSKGPKNPTFISSPRDGDVITIVDLYTVKDPETIDVRKLLACLILRGTDTYCMLANSWPSREITVLFTLGSYSTRMGDRVRSSAFTGLLENDLVTHLILAKDGINIDPCRLHCDPPPDDPRKRRRQTKKPQADDERENDELERNRGTPKRPPDTPVKHPVDSIRVDADIDGVVDAPRHLRRRTEYDDDDDDDQDMRSYRQGRRLQLDGENSVTLVDLFTPDAYIHFHDPPLHLFFQHYSVSRVLDIGDGWRGNLKAMLAERRDVITGPSTIGFLMYCREDMCPNFVNCQTFEMPYHPPQLEIVRGSFVTVARLRDEEDLGFSGEYSWKVMMTLTTLVDGLPRAVHLCTLKRPRIPSLYINGIFTDDKSIVITCTMDYEHFLAYGFLKILYSMCHNAIAVNFRDYKRDPLSPIATEPIIKMRIW